VTTGKRVFFTLAVGGALLLTFGVCTGLFYNGGS